MEDFRQQIIHYQPLSYSDRDHNQQQQQHDNPSKPLNLPFFATHQQPDNYCTTAAAKNDSLSNTTVVGSYPPDIAPFRERFLRVGEYFSEAQWQELELQALIYKYMLAGASVPLELILPIKTSLLNLTAAAASSSQSYYHHQTQHYDRHLQTTMLQEVSYLGRRNDVDPEPGRCRRTDGKKWRCSREVQQGRKYCDRHVHRSRTRSRKLVETIPTPTPTPKIATTTSACGGDQVLRHFLEVPREEKPKQWSSSGWGSQNNGASSLRGGGPLAEALRSSSSSTSVTTFPNHSTQNSALTNRQPA